jgi:hypothetical protein
MKKTLLLTRNRVYLTCLSLSCAHLTCQDSVFLSVSTDNTSDNTYMSISVHVFLILYLLNIIFFLSDGRGTHNATFACHWWCSRKLSLKRWCPCSLHAKEAQSVPRFERCCTERGLINNWILTIVFRWTEMRRLQIRKKWLILLDSCIICLLKCGYRSSFQ